MTLSLIFVGTRELNSPLFFILTEYKYPYSPHLIVFIYTPVILALGNILIFILSRTYLGLPHDHAYFVPRFGKILVNTLYARSFVPRYVELISFRFSLLGQLHARSQTLNAEVADHDEFQWNH